MTRSRDAQRRPSRIRLEPLAEVPPLAERGCKAHDFASCLLIDRQVLAWQEKGAVAPLAEVRRLRDLAEAGILEACTSAHVGAACDLAAERELTGTRGAELRVAAEQSCAGGGPIAALPAAERFHWLVTPRSAMIQCATVHGGLCADPAATLDHLFARLVAR